MSSILVEISNKNLALTQTDIQKYFNAFWFIGYSKPVFPKKSESDFFLILIFFQISSKYKITLTNRKSSKSSERTKRDNRVEYFAVRHTSVSSRQI